MIKLKFITNTDNKNYIPLIYTVYKKYDNIPINNNNNFINDNYIRFIIDETINKYNIKNIDSIEYDFIN
jgi:hypothetical protein